MDATTTIATTLISATVAVITGVLTFLGTRHAGKVKIQEIELVYQHRLQDGYLQRAAQHLDG